MILKSLKLKNIRSYIEQTINFPKNSVLLSGDIGSGKTTLLLAIEFALFGISKPELTGETLLRKGTTNATVELNFQIDDKDIIIQRNLKRTKISISQASGFLIINNVKKELTPVELKSEIISLLNYPEEFVTKNKNYIFRYTLYCPQEDMKLILQELPDNRLDILRKVFNLDKYKKIRENIQFYLKKVRIQNTILKTRIEPLENKKQELDGLRKQQEEIAKIYNKVTDDLRKTKEEVKDKKIKLEETEKQNQKHQEIKNQLLNLQNLLKEKQNQKNNLVEKQKQLEEKIAQLPTNINKEELTSEIDNLQKQKQDFLVKESELKTKIGHCQEKVSTLQKEISKLTENLLSTKEKEETLKKLKEELLKKEEINNKKEELEKKLDNLKQEINKNNLLLSQSKEIESKISQLDQCPTCLQDVSEEYKIEVLKTQEEKKTQAEKELKELNENKTQLEKHFLEIKQNLDIIIKKENLSTKLETELTVLKEKEKTTKEKKTQLQNTVQENNQLMKQLEEFDPNKLIELNQKINKNQETLQKLIQRKELEVTLSDVLQSQKNLNEETNNLLKQREQLELIKFPDLTETILKQKAELENNLEKEKNIFSEKAKLDTQTTYTQKQTKQLIEEIDKLNQYRAHSIKLTKNHHWLEHFLIKLTYTIEKQVMLKIHQLFSKLFQEWFSVLMEDENFSVRLDDSFTPVIEQDGHEILFNNLSGGERTASSLSYRLALNKVINDVIQEIQTKDLLILDEPTDGFSSEQLDRVRDVLEKLGLNQIIVVSHESKIESFMENVIRIEKRNGISEIV